MADDFVVWALKQWKKKEMKLGFCLLSSFYDLIDPLRVELYAVMFQMVNFMDQTPFYGYLVHFGDTMTGIFMYNSLEKRG